MPTISAPAPTPAPKLPPPSTSAASSMPGPVGWRLDPGPVMGGRAWTRATDPSEPSRRLESGTTTAGRAPAALGRVTVTVNDGSVDGIAIATAGVAVSDAAAVGAAIIDADVGAEAPAVIGTSGTP